MTLIDDVEIPLEVIDHGDEAVEIFLTSMASGNTERFAVMCAMRCPPGLKGTDSQNFRGQMNNPFPNMPEKLRQHYVKECRRLGIDFTGKVYKTSLVRKGYGGLKVDPEAFVSDTHDAASVIRRNGWSSEGMVRERGPSLDDVDVDGYEVTDKLVDEHSAREVIEKHGGRIKKKDYADLREKVKAKLKGSW
jgi:hypothetical protein